MGTVKAGYANQGGYEKAGRSWQEMGKQALAPRKHADREGPKSSSSSCGGLHRAQTSTAPVSVAPEEVGNGQSR